MKLNWKTIKPIAIKVATTGFKFAVATGTGIIVKSIVDIFATPQSRVKRIAVGVATAGVVSKINKVLDKYVDDEVQELAEMVREVRSEFNEVSEVVADASAAAKDTFQTATEAAAKDTFQTATEAVAEKVNKSRKRATRRKSPKARKVDPNTLAEVRTKMEANPNIDEDTLAVFNNAWKKGII